MAILKDLIVSGVSRFVGRIFSSKINSNSFNTLLTGTGTVAQDKGSGVSNRYVPAKWVFDAGVTLEDGDIFTIKMPVSGHDYGVYMSINGGSNFYPVVRSGTDRLTTHFISNSYITVVFDSSGSCGSIYSINGGDSRITVSGGVFKVLNWYDSGNTYTSAYCSTSSSTAAKTASNSGYSLKNNSYLYIVITQSNTYAGAITLNVNGQGAKPIYINGEPSSSTNYTLPLGTYLAFYDGRAYYFDTNGDIPLKKYENLYLTFKALERGTFTFTNAINYSLDCGKTWVSLAANTNSPTIAKGSTIMWKASLTPTSSSGVGTFSSTGKFTVGGNVMSLLYGDNFANQTSLSGKNYAFRDLFGGCTGMTSAENVVLPATTLAQSCYIEMFDGCENLTTAPSVLPARTLAGWCYSYMFQDCTSLTTAPQLPATTLAEGCYEAMFSNCASLTTAPSLPATTLANYCYNSMFYNCTNLATAPSLPATTLADYCYNSMFDGCENLTTAPQLHATTLAEGCYEAMFSNCASLTTAPVLSATTLADSCYSSMFNGCTSLTTAPSLPATTLANYCYNSMFYNCTRLTTAPSLPATTLVNNCYNSMFYNCTRLTTAPSVLPARTLAGWCYSYMFQDCTSLTTAPQLPATTLASNCYRNMFSYCSSLNSITCLATNISATNCTTGWVDGVAASGTFTKEASMTSWTTGNNGIPSGWTKKNA